MVREAQDIDSACDQLSWLLGAAFVVLGLLSRRVVRWMFPEDRPAALTLVCLYLGTLSLSVVTHLLRELISPGMHEAWSDAWFPALFCCFLALVPVLIAIGLWLCDNSARAMSIGFALLHLLSIYFWMRNPAVVAHWWTYAKAVGDFAVIAIGLSPSAVAACEWSSGQVPPRPLGID